LITALIVLAASLALSASASAAEEVNVTGTWQAVYQCQVGKCAGQERNGVFTLSQAAGSSAVTGTLNLGNGELAAPVSGTVSGSVLNLEGKGTNGYSASGVETISSNGLSWSGTYKDSVGTSGTLTATRPSLPVFAAGETEPRAAAIQVLCNYEVAPANFTCTASVGDASGLTPSKIPTGTVSFTAPSGSFTPLPKCALVATPGSTDVASCSVTYTPATKIPTGTSAPVTGAYSGDTTFAPSAAKSGTGAVVSPIVKSAKSTGEGASTTVSCPTGPGSCTVTVALTIEESGGGAIAARKAKRRKLTIGSTAVTVKGGQQSTVAVKLNQAGKRLLARHKRFTAMLSISSHGVVIKSQKVALKLKK
jgi:hypothetical protein